MAIKKIIITVLILLSMFLLLIILFVNRNNLLSSQEWYLNSKIEFRDTKLSENEKSNVTKIITNQDSLKINLLSSEKTIVEPVKFSKICDDCYDFYLNIYFLKPYHNGTPNSFRLVSTKGYWFDKICEVGVTIEKCENLNNLDTSNN